MWRGIFVEDLDKGGVLLLDLLPSRGMLKVGISQPPALHRPSPRGAPRREHRDLMLVAADRQLRVHALLGHGALESFHLSRCRSAEDPTLTACVIQRTIDVGNRE